MKEIKSKAFAECKYLQEAVIPKSTVIASDAFSDCKDVKIKWI